MGGRVTIDVGSVVGVNEFVTTGGQVGHVGQVVGQVVGGGVGGHVTTGGQVGVGGHVTTGGQVVGGGVGQVVGGRVTTGEVSAHVVGVIE